MTSRMGKQSMMDEILRRYTDAHPHDNVIVAAPTNARAEQAQKRLERLGFFCVGNLALNPNGAQVEIWSAEDKVDAQ